MWNGGAINTEIDYLVSRAAEAVAGDLIALAYSIPKNRLLGRLRILAIADPLDGGLSRDMRAREGVETDLLVLDRGLFESDVEESALLEVGASILLLHYTAVEGDEYLSQFESRYRRRKIEESVTGIVLNHPDLSSELLIDPRYFVDDTLKNVSHLIPEAVEAIESDEVAGLIGKYLDALRELEGEGVIRFVDSDYVAVDDGFIETISKRGIFPLDPLVRAQTQLDAVLRFGLKSLTGLFQPLLGTVFRGIVSPKSSEHLNPDRFLFFPTATGLSSFSDSMELEEVVGRLAASGTAENISMERMGSALNEVYLISYKEGCEERRAVLKRYPTWVSLKWAPLALWTLGTQNFAVLGRSRLERECAATQLLSRMGIKVPRILYSSFRDRLVVKEFVEGTNLTDIVKASFRSGELVDREANLLRSVGEIVASIHGEGYTLGDCKPDNFIVDAEGNPYIVDLEQGARDGNPTWDLAEFLLFSGHYAGPLDKLSGVADVARSFVGGYTAGGGEREYVREAAELRYTRVFAPFTLPQVIYTIAKACRDLASS